jgi:hypothetical protein
MGGGFENQFCTILDRGYLAQGLVLYRSLSATCDAFLLRVWCVDRASRDLLDRMALPGLVTIAAEELERHDPELRAVREQRTLAEYCMTAKAPLCLYVLHREPHLGSITYLDADLMFISDPVALFAKAAGDSILIVPQHNRECHVDSVHGSYQAGSVGFRRDDAGVAALRWWRERCLESCSLEPRDGRWADQRYLEDWPERFPGVHVHEHAGVGLASWNSPRYALSRGTRGPLVDGRPVVFYHYSGLRMYSGLTGLRRAGLLAGTYNLVRRPLPIVWRQAWWAQSPAEQELLWVPYLKALGQATLDLRRLDPGFTLRSVAGWPDLRARATAAACSRVSAGWRAICRHVRKVRPRRRLRRGLRLLRRGLSQTQKALKSVERHL